MCPNSEDVAYDPRERELADAQSLTVWLDGECPVCQDDMETNGDHCWCDWCGYMYHVPAATGDE